MAYESSDPAYPAFTIKFARSKDLMTWEKIPDAVFGKDRYTACPCIRWDHNHLISLRLPGPREAVSDSFARLGAGL